MVPFKEHILLKNLWISLLLERREELKKPLTPVYNRNVFKINQMLMEVFLFEEIFNFILCEDGELLDRIIEKGYFNEKETAKYV